MTLAPASPNANRGRWLPVLAALVPLMLAACAGGASVTSPTAGLSCVDDSADCIGKRQRTLNYLVNAPDRAWIQQAPTASAYASGVRLFAYKTKKGELSCSELQRGVDEAKAAPRVLRGPSGKSLTPAQVSRGTMLASEVARDLQREKRRRCKRG